MFSAGPRGLVPLPIATQRGVRILAPAPSRPSVLCRSLARRVPFRRLALLAASPRHPPLPRVLLRRRLLRAVSPRVRNARRADPGLLLHRHGDLAAVPIPPVPPQLHPVRHAARHAVPVHHRAREKPPPPPLRIVVLPASSRPLRARHPAGTRRPRRERPAHQQPLGARPARAGAERARRGALRDGREAGGMDGGAGVSRGGREGARGVRGERAARVAGRRDARRGGAELRAAAEPDEGAERIERDAICRGMPRDS